MENPMENPSCVDPFPSHLAFNFPREVSGTPLHGSHAGAAEFPQQPRARRNEGGKSWIAPGRPCLANTRPGKHTKSY